MSDQTDQTDQTGSVQLRTSAVISFMWAFASFAGNRLVVFISTVVLARLLLPEDFGVVAAALVVLSFINIALDLGVGASVIQRQETGVGPWVHAAFSLQLVAATVMTLSFLALAPTLASALGVAGSESIFRGMAPIIMVKAIGQTHDAILRRDMRFRRRTMIGLTQALTRLAVSVVLAVTGGGAWALVLGMLAGETVATALNLASTRFRPRFSLQRSILAPLIAFGGAVTALRLASTVMSSADFVVVGSKLGGTALGVYSLAFRLPELVIDNVLVTFSQVAFPVYSQARMVGDQLPAAMLRSLQVVTLFGFTAGAGLAVASRDVVHVVLGDEWVDAAGPMVLIALAMGIGAVGYAAGDIYLALGKPQVLLRINLGMLPPMVVGFVLAAPHGITAVAWVHFVSSLLISIIQFIVAHRLLHVPVSKGLHAMRGGAGAAIGIVVAALPLRLFMSEGPLALAAIVLAGAVGAACGAMLADRNTADVLRSIARSGRGRARA